MLKSIFKKYFLISIFFVRIIFSAFSDEAELYWQIDASFPDWISNANFSANNSRSFQFYQGQGNAVITVSEGVKSFSFYINDNRVNTKKLKAPGIYTVDISEYTRNGLNTLQVSDVKFEGQGKAVRVQIPYPVVLDGKLKKSSLSKESFALIDKIISADVKNGFTSAQLAVVKDGRLLYQNSWGTVRTGDETGRVTTSPNVTDDTLYDLASVSKMFTVAYAIQALVTQKKLSPETKITEILGDEFADNTISVNFVGKEKIPLEKIKEWKKNLTVRDVMSHTAGFAAGYPYFNDNYDLRKNEFNVGSNKNQLFSGNDGSPETRELTLQQICRTPLVYEPHTKLIYSDIDFMLLCFVVEKVSGQRLDDFLRETFWNPLGLSRMTFNPLQNGFSEQDCAATDPTGNSYAGELLFTNCRTHTLQGEVHDSNAFYAMGGVSGHAGLFSNATDLAKLASVMLTGGWGNYKFFSRNVIDLFTSPQYLKDADYGFGWWLGGDVQNARNFGSLCSSRAFGHQGFTGTLVFIEPEENLVIVYLTNKINTPMTSPESLNNVFAGNSYQSANLGFVPQIILMGLNKDVGKSQWKSFLYDMKEGARRVAEKKAPDDKNDSRWLAYESLESVYKSF